MGGEESQIRPKIGKLLVSVEDLRVMDFPIVLCTCLWAPHTYYTAIISVGLLAPHGHAVLCFVYLWPHMGLAHTWHLTDVC